MFLPELSLGQWNLLLTSSASTSLNHFTNVLHVLVQHKRARWELLTREIRESGREKVLCQRHWGRRKGYDVFSWWLTSYPRERKNDSFENALPAYKYRGKRALENSVLQRVLRPPPSLHDRNIGMKVGESQGQRVSVGPPMGWMDHSRDLGFPTRSPLKLNSWLWFSFFP